MLDSSDETLQQIGLLGTDPNEGFDRLVRLAAQLCGAPVAAISIVLPDRDWQHFRSAIGLPEPWRSLKGTPVSHSFCRLVRASGLPLLVGDARCDDRLKDNRAIAELGAPIHGPDGCAIGAVCVVDGVPRAWSAEDQAHMAELAAAVDERIAHLAALYERDMALGQAKHASYARSRFLTSMSHEIRTPLFGVLGLAQMLEEVVTEPPARRLCQALRSSGEALLNIVNDLLDLARLEAGRLELAQAAFDPAEIAAEAAALHRSLALRKGLAFTLTADYDKLAERIGDSNRLRQILHNLLGNAVKFTEAGSVRLSIAGRAGEPLLIEVADSGPGITPERAACVFEPFREGDDGSGGAAGPGLGLPLVKRLVDLMGGEVTIESAPGAGTTLRLRLPLPCGEAGAARAAGEAGAAVLQGLRVLAVDDNATNRMILEGLLARAGAAVTLADDGLRALDLWEPGRFDVLLLDIAMPEFDGFNLLRAIQAKAVAQGATPPPAVAASSMLDEVADYFAAGFAAHVPKPFMRADLIREISRALRRAPA